MRHRLTTIVTVAALTLRERVDRIRRSPDAGLTTAEYLMWIAIIAAVVIAVGAIVTTLFTNKANGLTLN